MPLYGLLLVHCTPLLCQADVKLDDVRLDAVRSAYLRWIEEVEYVGNYEIAAGTSRSIQAAVSGDWQSSGVRWRGVVAKWGPFRRCSFLPVAATSRGVADGMPQSYNVSEEEIVGPALGLLYFADNGLGEPGQLRFFAPSPTANPWAAGDLTKALLTPVSMNSKPPGSYFTWEDREPSSTDVRADGNAWTVDLVFRGEPRDVHRQLRFRVDCDPPVVAEIRGKSTYRNGRAGSEHEIHVLDWASCPGGLVPKRFLMAVQNSRGQTTVQEWRSDDLGTRMPGPSDFVLEVPKSTRIYGLTNAARKTHLGHFDVTRLTSTDLSSGDDESPTDDDAGGPDWGGWVVRANVAAAVVLLLVVLWRWRRASLD